MFGLGLGLFHHLFIYRHENGQHRHNWFFVDRFQAARRVFAANFAKGQHDRIDVRFNYDFHQQNCPNQFRALALALSVLGFLIGTHPAFIVRRTRFAASFDRARVHVVFT